MKTPPPPPLHIKYKMIDFAPFNNHLWHISFLEPIWNDFYDGLSLAYALSEIYRALIVPKWSSLNPHNFMKNYHRGNIFSNLSSGQQ